MLNEETGYLYSVGSGTCSGGPHVVNLNNDPLNPVRSHTRVAPPPPQPLAR